jgi:hypothetical protein
MVRCCVFMNFFVNLMLLHKSFNNHSKHTYIQHQGICKQQINTAMNVSNTSRWQIQQTHICFATQWTWKTHVDHWQPQQRYIFNHIFNHSIYMDWTYLHIQPNMGDTHQAFTTATNLHIQLHNEHTRTHQTFTTTANMCIYSTLQWYVTTHQRQSGRVAQTSVTTAANLCICSTTQWTCKTRVNHWQPQQIYKFNDTMNMRDTLSSLTTSTILPIHRMNLWATRHCIVT